MLPRPECVDGSHSGRRQTEALAWLH